MKKISIISVMLIVLSTSIFGQTDGSINILSLDECMYLAVKNSPELRTTSAIIDQATANNEKINTSWLLEGMSVVGNSSYVYRRHLDFEGGSNTDPVTNNQSYFGSQTNNNIGISLALPLSTWKYKKQDKIIAVAMIDEKEGIHESQTLVIKNHVIILYKQYEQASMRLTTSSNNVEAQKSALTVAEEQFTSGIIDVEKYSNVKQSAINAEDSFNDSRTTLEIAYNALKLRVGQEIIVE